MAMKGKRIAAGLLALALCFCLPVRARAAEAPGSADAPRGSWRAAALIEQSTGRVLFAENGEEELPMASTTKIMTALLAVESGRLQEEVEIDARMVGVEGSSIYLEAGEKLTVEELVYGLMLRSGNDAAVALALTLGGSTEDFAAQMNARAAELGLRHTHFVNPHGLPAEGHYTSALDLARLAAAAYREPVFRQVVSTQYKVIPWLGHDYDRAMRNKNRLLGSYEGANGVKTGYTKAAGRCLVAAAERDGMQLIAVVLDAPDMWEDACALLDYGFANYGMEEALPGLSEIARLPSRLAPGGGLPVGALLPGRVPLRAGEEAQVRFVLPEEADFPVARWQVLGYAILEVEGEALGRVPLCALSGTARPPWDYGRGLRRVLEGFF